MRLEDLALQRKVAATASGTAVGAMTEGEHAANVI
jgi:hypothetical protein